MSTINIEHDDKAKATYINIKNTNNIAKTVAVQSDIIIDYDNENKIIGIEILGTTNITINKIF